MAMMTLGNFFEAAAYARPVNPKPVSFTAVSKDADVLPGGKPNPSKKQIAAKIDACLIFIGDGLLQARLDARKYLQEQGADPKKKMVMFAIDDGDFQVEVQYQILWRAIRSYDAAEKLAGDQLFPDVDNVRKLVELQECNRLMRAYDKYVEAEHPEVVDDATFRGAEAPSR